AAYFFRRLAEQAVEPVLIALLHYIAADEVRHAQNASDLIAKRIATDPAVIGGVLDAAAHFRHLGSEAIGAVPVALPGDPLAIRAFALVVAGAGVVVAVGLNATQNDLVELKLVAASRLGGPLAVGFLGGGGAAPASRLATYARLRDALSSAARAHWDARPGDLARGVLHTGASERFLALVVRAIKMLVHPERRVRRLLACRSVAEQRAFYEREWNTWRWRALFKVLLNRWAFRRSHEPAFFEHVENPSFSGHFLRAAQHALTDLPVADNYFLHVALTGWYPPGGARPPYLTADGATSLAVMAERLTLVDGSYTAFLRTQPDASVTGFALSNICEWLSAGDVEQLFAEIVRTAAPGARVCFRNFVGWTEVPARWRDVVVEDQEWGATLSRGDRSLVQRRFAICRVEKGVT